MLTVHGLPTDENPNGTWYVDAGLGDALYEPLPLLPGTYEQRPFRLGLEETPDGVGDWHLTHDPGGSFRGMAWRSAPVEMDAFADRHAWLSTSPESGFVRFLVVLRRATRAASTCSRGSRSDASATVPWTPRSPPRPT